MVTKVSILIPSRNEQFLQKTINDVFDNAAGDVECIVSLDGYWPSPQLKDYPGLHIIHRSKPVGMREGINACAAVATGEYLMKLDAHCMVAEGFDRILLEGYHEDNWIVVPRRRSLDPENWAINPKTPIDYHYLTCPVDDKEDGALHGRWWRQRGKDRADIMIDDEMSSQGSCWFMSRRHWEWLGGLSCEGYGDFIQEFQELGMKTWLGGGAVKVNKNTWYAHLHKGRRYGRGYPVSRRSWHKGLRYSADLWLNNRWPERIHDMGWLIEKFSPVPTWLEDWPDLWDESRWTREINI